MLKLIKRFHSAKIVEINGLKEFKEHLNSNPKVIVDFFAEWCGPCKMLAPLLEKAAESNPSVSFVKVNVDEGQELASQFQITAMPTVASFKNGKISDQFMGVKDANFIEKFIKKL